ncbi:MAG: hypothetical protein ACRDQA_18970 [Nocardioidaceae bacterium]
MSALHPGLVGSRVVVRRVLPSETGPTGGPAMTDVLGVLEEWGEHEIVVRRADDTTVRVRLEDIVTGKPVPPPPPRRRPRAPTDLSDSS